MLAFCSLLCSSFASNIFDDFGGQICICTSLGYCFEFGVLREIDSEGFPGNTLLRPAGRTPPGSEALSVLPGAERFITNAYLPDGPIINRLGGMLILLQLEVLDS